MNLTAQAANVIYLFIYLLSRGAAAETVYDCTTTLPSEDQFLTTDDIQSKFAVKKTRSPRLRYQSIFASEFPDKEFGDTGLTKILSRCSRKAKTWIIASYLLQSNCCLRSP